MKYVERLVEDIFPSRCIDQRATYLPKNLALETSNAKGYNRNPYSTRDGGGGESVS